MSFIFQENIPIGKIKNISLKENSSYFIIDVELFEDFSSLRSVYIISNSNKSELDNLNVNNEIY